MSSNLFFLHVREPLPENIHLHQIYPLLFLSLYCSLIFWNHHQLLQKRLSLFTLYTQRKRILLRLEVLVLTLLNPGILPLPVFLSFGTFNKLFSPICASIISISPCHNYFILFGRRKSVSSSISASLEGSYDKSLLLALSSFGLTFLTSDTALGASSSNY